MNRRKEEYAEKLLVWLLPVLFGWQVVDSTEIPFELTAQEEYELTHTIYDQYFQTIPQNPNVFKLRIFIRMKN